MTNICAKTSPPAVEQAFKILLVDSLKSVLEAGEKILGESFQLVCVDNIEDAWQNIIQNHDISVVFISLDMPNLGGYQLLQRIRSNRDAGIRHLPVVIVTKAVGGEESDRIKFRAAKLGATDFIDQPFHAADLYARATAYADYQRTTEVLSQHSQLDPLTRLCNLSGFELRLNKDIAYASRHCEDLAILKIRIDQLDALRSHLDKDAIDHMICDVARMLQAMVRSEDTVAIDWQSSFYMALPAAQPEGAKGLALRICRQLNGQLVYQAEGTVEVSMSIAVCTLDKGFKPKLQEVFDQLDSLLTEANSCGRGEIAVAHIGFEQPVLKSPFISIDRLLVALEYGDTVVVNKQLDDAVEHLKPLVKQLSEQQLRRLLAAAVSADNH